MLRKKLYGLSALVLSASMLLGACQKSEPAPSTDAGQPQTELSQAAQEDTEVSEGDTSAAEASAVDWDEMAEIELYYFTFIAPKDVEHVEDAINAITEEKINTHVNISVLDVNSYIQQIGIMMAGNERIDLMLTAFASASYSAMMAQNQLMDMAPFIEDYGPDIKALYGDMLNAASMNGGTYAVPCYRNMVSTEHIFMRQDVLEDLGLLEKARNMTSFEEYEEILKAVHESEKWSYLYPSMVQKGSGAFVNGVNASGNFADADVFDTLGDTLGIVHLDENGKVSLNMESESYQKSVAMVRDWAEKGYVYYDMSNAGGSIEDYVKADAVFSFIATSEFGAETAKSMAAGMPLVSVKVNQGQVTSEACTKFAYCIPATAKEPEAAVAFLNLAVTSPEINNLMAWGVEGRDYEVVDGVASYIAGNEEPEYHLFDYSVPNQFLVHPWKGDPADFREKSLEDLKAAKISEYMGFSCDLTNLVNETAAVTNVIEEFQVQLISGQASEEVLQQFIDKLHSVNVDALIEEYQKQLDAWNAAK